MTLPLIDVPTLADWLTRAPPPVVLDARARLDDADAGAALWRESHIASAQHADLNHDLAAPATAGGGRHPLPDKADFAARLRAWGVTPERRVVVYDDTGGRIAAARAWWLLIWAGHPSAYVLDGGWPAWRAAGGATTAAAAAPVPSAWQPCFDDDLIASADDVARGDAAVLDARAGERFRGEHEPLDPVAGHIPGARNVPGASLLDTCQRLRPADELGAVLPEAEAAIAYCGSGVSACQLILAYAQLGRPLPRLYPGSWSAWSRATNRPVATGAD